MATALMVDWEADERDTAAESAELRRLRTSLGLSQETVARRLRVSLKTYNSWERGARCQWSALELLRRWVAEADAEPVVRPGTRSKK